MTDENRKKLLDALAGVPRCAPYDVRQLLEEIAARELQAIEPIIEEIIAEERRT